MTKISLLSTSLAAMLGALLPATPAQAIPKTFVSSTGGGTACTFTAPCNNFTAAYNATDSGGEIACLDSGFFQGTGILKPITIDCAGTGATVFDGFNINAAGSTVVIRNLTFDGVGTANLGIVFENGAALIVENCVFANYTTGFGIGILFRAPTPARLVVTNSRFTGNGTNAATGGGIVVRPGAGGTALVALDRVTVAKNVFGIVADGTGSTGGINMTVSDSISAGNSQDGVIAVTPSGGAPIGVMVKNTRSINNAIGIRSIGPNVTVRVSNSTVIGNGTGLSFGSGGALLTFGNNEVQANGNNGAFSGSVGLQ